VVRETTSHAAAFDRDIPGRSVALSSIPKNIFYIMGGIYEIFEK